MSQTAHYILLLLCDCCGWHVEYFICVVVSSLQKPFQTHLFDWRFYFCSCFLQYMSDYLLKWFALCYRTVVCPVCLPCLCILSVCNVGALWPNGWMDQDEILARSHRVHPTENRDLAIPQFFANSLVDHKIAKLGGYRKISAKYAVFGTISGVGLQSALTI